MDTKKLEWRSSLNDMCCRKAVETATTTAQTAIYIELRK